MHEQKELPLFPLPRWPTWAYLRGALVVYLVVPFLAAGAFFVGVVAVAQPLFAASFLVGCVSGAVTVVLARSWLPKVRRHLGRIMAFPHHA
jgi:hypothetical protein